MKRVITAGLVSVALAAGVSALAFGQATEDEIAKSGQFPLAAKPGEDSHAIDRAPAGAMNQGKFDMDKMEIRPCLGRSARAPRSGIPSSSR